MDYSKDGIRADRLFGEGKQIPVSYEKRKFLDGENT